RAAAGIPEDLEFKTKPQLAAEMIKQVLAEGRCPPWVTGDEVYGRDAKLRLFLEERRTGYVLKIPCSFRITLPTGQKARADHAAARGPPGGGQPAPAGRGSKGERDYHWACLATASACRHLLIRRRLHDPADLAYFSATCPPAGPARSPPWCAWRAAAGRLRKISVSGKPNSAWPAARSAATPPSPRTWPRPWPRSPAAPPPRPWPAPPPAPSPDRPPH